MMHANRKINITANLSFLSLLSAATEFPVGMVNLEGLFLPTRRWQWKPPQTDM